MTEFIRKEEPFHGKGNKNWKILRRRTYFITLSRKPITIYLYFYTRGLATYKSQNMFSRAIAPEALSIYITIQILVGFNSVIDWIIQKITDLHKTTA